MRPRSLQGAGLERNRDNGTHTLRHDYASVLLDNGVSIRAVSEHLGHALGAPTESSRNAKRI